MRRKARLPAFVGERQAMNGVQASGIDVTIHVSAALVRQCPVESQVASAPPEARAKSVAIIAANTTTRAKARVLAADPERVQIGVWPAAR